MFKIGDIVTGTKIGDQHYSITKSGIRMIVTDLDPFKVRCLSGVDTATSFQVNPSFFVAAPKIRAVKKAPRYAKAIVIEAPGYEPKLSTGKVVTLDLGRRHKAFHQDSMDTALVSVIGFGGMFYAGRFAIDPTLPVDRKELING